MNMLALAFSNLLNCAGNEPTREMSEPREQKKWECKDHKARAVFGLSLSDETLGPVRDTKTAKEMWKVIKNVFEGHTTLNKLVARRNIYTATPEGEEKVLTYINRVKKLADCISSMDVEIDQNEISMALLHGLPSRFENFISAPDALGNENKLFTLDWVESRLLQE